METNDRAAELKSLAALAEPQRLALYDYVATQPGAVSRDEAADALGIARHVAAFHLDRLESDGLLVAEFRRTSGKTGPGAGRPSKFYRRAEREVEVALPPRRYALAGSLMARAIAAAGRGAMPVAAALQEEARAAGLRLGAAAATGSSRRDLGALADHLDGLGYEVRRGGDTLSLANCPFRALAEEDTELICGMNLDLLSGFVEGFAAPGVSVSLEPAPGHCCVALRSG